MSFIKASEIKLKPLVHTCIKCGVILKTPSWCAQNVCEACCKDSKCPLKATCIPYQDGYGKWH